MAFQARKNNLVSEVLELVDGDGNVVHSIMIDINCETIAREFNNRRDEISFVFNSLNSARSAADYALVSRCFTDLQAAVVSLFNSVFGASNTDIIVKFFDGCFLDMVSEVFPFISKMIIPHIYDYIEGKKKMFRKNSGGSKHPKKNMLGKFGK